MAWTLTMNLDELVLDIRLALEKSMTDNNGFKHRTRSQWWMENASPLKKNWFYAECHRCAAFGNETEFTRFQKNHSIQNHRQQTASQLSSVKRIECVCAFPSNTNRFSSFSFQVVVRAKSFPLHFVAEQQQHYCTCCWVDKCDWCIILLYNQF